MPIVAVFQGPGFTRESYEATVRALTNGAKDRMESAGDWPVEGLIAHIAGESKDGFRVVDVWESAEAFQRFGEMLMPVVKALGIGAEPQVYDAHTCVID